MVAKGRFYGYGKANKCMCIIEAQAVEGTAKNYVVKGEQMDKKPK